MKRPTRRDEEKRDTPGKEKPSRVPPRGRKGVPSTAPPRPQRLVLPMRLNRYIARSGVCSRRDADTMIREGKVMVNGAVTKEMGVQVQEGDRIEVNGKLISPRAGLYILLNKPGDAITTTDDERDRRTVLDLIDLPEAEKAALFPVGRLDRETTGVLLLTTDGDLAHRLMHPSYQVEKLYRVRTRKPITDEEIGRLAGGIVLDDGPAKPDRIAFIQGGDRHQIGLSIHEGRNRIVRRLLEAIGHRVEELERVRYAGLTSEGVRRGHWRRLEEHELARLYRLVKLKSK